ncbi:MAG: tetratricopeptide repeat protein [Candidatus Binatia bacterium]
MASARKRLTRKDIRQPDQFITFTSRLFRLFEEYKAVCITAIAGIILISASVWGWSLYRNRQYRLASRSYFHAISRYHAGEYQKAIEMLRDVDSYGSTAYSGASLFYQAKSYINLNSPKKAVEILKTLISEQEQDSFLRQLAVVTLAYTQESAEDCKTAAATFSEAASLPGPLKADARLGEARCSEKNHAFKEALTAYRQFLTGNPDSTRKGEILLRIQALELKLGEITENK